VAITKQHDVEKQENMKINRNEVTSFKPITLVIETREELGMMIEAMWEAYVRADDNSDLESFVEEIHDELKEYQ
jgi:hypothetical protein